MDGIAKAQDRGVRFGRKPILVPATIKQVRKLRKSGRAVPEIMLQTSLSKASVYRALAGSSSRSRTILLTAMGPLFLDPPRVLTALLPFT